MLLCLLLVCIQNTRGKGLIDPFACCACECLLCLGEVFFKHTHKYVLLLL